MTNNNQVDTDAIEEKHRQKLKDLEEAMRR
jgi:hypothetical protein